MRGGMRRVGSGSAAGTSSTPQAGRTRLPGVRVLLCNLEFGFSVSSLDSNVLMRLRWVQFVQYDGDDRRDGGCQRPQKQQQAPGYRRQEQV